jgi:uncharacterized YigZ family protein
MAGCVAGTHSHYHYQPCIMQPGFTYKTLEKPSEAIYVDKGSRFLGYAYPITSEEELKLLIKNLQAQHQGARHFCYACRLGKTALVERSSDDGEPSGTAGKPILNQILSVGLTEICIVVVRYFGGTLLGTTGLIKAYKTAARAAIENGYLVEKKITVFKQVTIPYEVYNKFMSLVKKFPVPLEMTSSTDVETSFWLEIPLEIEMEIMKEINLILPAHED